MESNIHLAGTIDFLDLKIEVYRDPLMNNESTGHTCWAKRSSKNEYTGIVYLGPNGFTYPDGVEPPIESERDREIVPKFIVIYQDLTETVIKNIYSYLEKEHKRRNNLN